MTMLDRLLFRGVDVDTLTSGAVHCDDPPPTTRRLLTDGGQDTGRADGDASDGGEVPNALDGVSEEQLEAADIELEKLKQLPKDELIGLLSEIIGDDEAESSAATEDTASESTPDAAAATGDSQTAASGEPDTDGKSEPDDEYRRPAELDLSPGTTMLVQCGSQDDRKDEARRDLLGIDTASNRNVLLIQYRSLDVDRLEEIATTANRVKVITIGCSQTVPNAVSDSVEVVNINNPNDVTRLGILATKTLDDWSALDGAVAVSLDPLDVLFRYKTVEGTFRFLHIFLGKLSSGGAITHFFVNPSASDPQDINTLKPLFDYIMSIDADGVRVEGS